MDGQELLAAEIRQLYRALEQETDPAKIDVLVWLLQAKITLYRLETNSWKPIV